ncbi:unnamed protein product [Linum tenue]|uniref:Iron-sulphur binding protein LdpA C-terminal domain-containing protein n=1 Tax=Linum tenue TaxID=586396 RepID=A0AAV0S3R8_9ROSI|nr:unnamed protein product [Linum tenue]
MVYTLAGVDCIDCAADAAVVSAVNEGIDAAMEVVELRRPWVMISVNDDDDLHFRKAGSQWALKAPFDKFALRSVETLNNSIIDGFLISLCLPLTVLTSLSCISCNGTKLDGRPMSGDIGRGATRESIAFAVRLAVAKDRPLGFLQLAGGTNAHTADGLRKEGLFQTTLENSNDVRSVLASPSSAFIGGVAYGGYARKIVGRVLSSMPSQQGPSSIEDHPELLVEALGLALGLVGTVKCYHPVHHSSFR